MSRGGTVIIVDDEAGVRKVLATLFQNAGLECVSLASGEELLQQQPPQGPSCLLLDLRLTGSSGLEIQRELKDTPWANVPTLFLSGHGDVRAAVTAMKDGAVDFIEKPFDNQALLRKVEEALSTSAKQTTASTITDERLTPREREVCGHLAVGKTAKMIAQDLEISPRTVEYHRANIMEKLGVASVSELLLKIHSDNSQS